MCSKKKKNKKKKKKGSLLSLMISFHYQICQSSERAWEGSILTISRLCLRIQGLSFFLLVPSFFNNEGDICVCFISRAWSGVIRFDVIEKMCFGVIIWHKFSPSVHIPDGGRTPFGVDFRVSGLFFDHVLKKTLLLSYTRARHGLSLSLTWEEAHHSTSQHKMSV